MQIIEYTTTVEDWCVVRVKAVFCNSGICQKITIYDYNTNEKIENISKTIVDSLKEDAYTVLKYKDFE